jgi:predicted dehydrogenase
MNQPVRWGVVGPGAIADKVVLDFKHVPGAYLLAVASRSAERGAAFAAKHSIERSYGSYRAIIEDPDVDALYIATPHPQHLAIAVAAVRAGKAVLVEKAFTATVAGAQQLIHEARSHHVFAMEAMWTRFQPAIVRTRELLADGAIGTIRGVQADLGVPRAYDPSDRLFAPELGGGAMLDLGVYVVSFAQMVLGTPDSVQARGFLTPDGVDATASLLLSFPQQATATLMISLHSVMPGAARIFGDAGWIDVPPRFHHPTSVVLHRPDHESETMYLPPIGAGYAHELIEATESVQAGRTESAVMPLDDTLAVQRILETALTQLGVQYAEDPTALD